MMKTEYTECRGFLQRNGVEHKEYEEECIAESQKVELTLGMSGCVEEY